MQKIPCQDLEKAYMIIQNNVINMILFGWTVITNYLPFSQLSLITCQLSGSLLKTNMLLDFSFPEILTSAAFVCATALPKWLIDSECNLVLEIKKAYKKSQNLNH